MLQEAEHHSASEPSRGRQIRLCQSCPFRSLPNNLLLDLDARPGAVNLATELSAKSKDTRVDQVAHQEPQLATNARPGDVRFQFLTGDGQLISR